MPDAMRRYTCTGLVCPMRWHRAIAWLSTCGFQSESSRITVSAVCRLTPSPPARVVMMKAKYLGAGGGGGRSPCRR